MEFGKQIQKHRKVFRISQNDLAEKIFVSRQTISNWENNKSYLDVHSLILLSQVSQISVDELLHGKIKNLQLRRRFIKTIVMMRAVSYKL